MASKLVSRPIVALTAAMARLAKGDTDVELGINLPARRDRRHDFRRAGFRDNAIERHRLASEADAEQQKRIVRQEAIYKALIQDSAKSPRC